LSAGPLTRAVVRSHTARLLVTIALLALVATQIDWNELRDALGEGSWWWFGASVGTVAIALAIGAFRWHVLLQAVGVNASPLESARAYGIGAFSNTFLPTSFGGDAVRAWLVGQPQRQFLPAAASVVLDRLSAVVCFFVVAWACIVASPGSVPRELVGGLGIVSAAVLGAAALLVLAHRFRRSLSRALSAGGIARLREARAAAGSMLERRTVLAIVALSGVAYQLLVVLATWFVTRALNLDLSFAIVAVASLLVLLLTLVPISIGGFGLREGGFVVLLDTAGIGAAQATLVSLLAVAAFALASLPGALFLLSVRGDYPARDAKDL
jgi:uncharacterized protein (TIRG00374 family)